MAKSKAQKKKSAPKAKKKVVAQKKMMMNSASRGEHAPLTPLNDRIVVRALSEEETGTRSPSGIIIPDTVSKEKPEQGIVIAVGPGRYEDGKRTPISVSVGDRVIFSKYGFDEVKVGGKEYFIVSEQSVLAVIND